MVSAKCILHTVYVTYTKSKRNITFKVVELSVIPLFVCFFFVFVFYLLYSIDNTSVLQ